MAVSYARASRIASSCPKDFNFASFMYANEVEYPMWTNPRRWLDFVKSRPESVAWNGVVAALALISFVIVSMDYESSESVFGIPVSLAIDTAYNAIYGLHVAGNFYRYYNNEIRWYLVDLISYSHYLTTYLPAAVLRRVHDLPYIVKMTCYHLRLHRPFRFLWGLNDYYLKGSTSGTLFKYWYIFTLLHVMCANLFIWIEHVNPPQLEKLPDWLLKNRSNYFYRSVYVIYKRFIPIGMDIAPAIGDDRGRLLEMLVLTTGSLMVTGITIASLSLAICLHMRPEEVFRARVRLIMFGMKKTHVPKALCDKVETFYRMYWHKQKAVSVTQLLPTYPPTLANTIYTDIYFEAQQKSIILRDLSYQLLSEIAQRMKTINYIPGDIIIKRNTSKSAMVYISYGDVEMMTAEDDETPVLRFTRGSVLNPCAGAAAVASSRAHVCIRAATFCTAHVLAAVDIWRIAARYGQIHGQSFLLHSSFQEHFDRVARHYAGRPHQPAKYKSTILILKRNLIELKQARDENGELILGRQDVFLELAGCYIMRNQPDAGLMEESDTICLRPTFPCILQPASSLLIMWKIFVAIMTIVVTFVHPYNFVFIKNPHVDFRFFDFMMTVVYLVDIMIHLSTGSKIEEGVPVTFMQTSSQQVSSFWFVLDVVSVMPIFNFIGDGSFAGVNKLCKLPKVFRVLKEMEDISLYQSDTLRFFAYCLLIVLLNWLVATLQQGYMCFMHGYCNLKSITTAPFWTKGALDDSHDAIINRLWYSIYWALSFTTFCAHKTFKMTMQEWDKQLFIMVLLEVCDKFHMIMEAVYSATIMVKEAMRNQYESCIENVKMFFVKNDLDPVLRHRFISYLQLCWYTDKAYSITHGKQTIYFDLPQHVYQDISAFQRNKYIVCIPFMKYLHVEIVKTLCAKAHFFYTSPQEILLNTGDICNEIYVIKQGFCEVVDPTTKNVVSILTSKNHFGDIECLMRIPAYYTVRAVSHVQIFSISRKHLSSVLATPKIKDAILYTKLEEEYTRLLRNRQPPFLKYSLAAPAPSRQLFPTLRKHEPDDAFLQPFHKLGFFSITRYVFPRFTIRPDGKYLRRYEWFRALCAFLSAFIFPVYYLLVLQFQWLEHVSYFLDVTAYCDVFQRLLVGYFNENGILVYHPVSTAAHYIKGPMVVDLLGCLPFECFDDLHQKIYSNEKYKWTPITMQYLMCNRILQLYRFPAALEVLDEYIGRQDIIFVIKAIPILMVVINTVTSFLVLLSVTAYGMPGGGWSLIPLAVDFAPWIITHERAVGYNITESPINLFITVYYWATFEITTTGLECFHPNRYAQLVVLIIGMLIGSIMIPYFAVRVLSIRSNVNQALAAFQENLKDLLVFMERENFHKDLQEEALSYYEYTWVKTGGTDYSSILKLCDQFTLRTDAILHIYGQTFHKCPILYHCDLSLRRLLGRAVHSVYYRGGMTVIDRSDVIANLYFVDYGIMEARDPEDDDLVVTKLPRGSMFGNLENKAMTVCESRFVANTNLHLLMIEAWLFYKILKDFPSIRVRMAKFRPNDENYIIGSLRGQSTAQVVWKERAISTAIIIVTREGILKYIHTHGKILQIILIIVSIICVYGDLYNAAFQDNRQNLIILLYAMDVIFICKIVINYFMPTITEENSESRNALEKAKKQYYRGDFKYDIFSVLPVELFCFLFNNPWSAFAFLRLNRFLRVTTINSNLKQYHELLSINLTATTITATLIWFTLFLHTSTCMWYLLGVIHDSLEPRSSWRWNANKTYMCNNDYICSIYFVMTTFSQNGVGDILPRQQAEVIFVILLMILSTMMYMIYVGEFSNIMQYQFFRCFHFYSEFLELKEFLKNNRVSPNLVNLTYRYTLHLWRTSRGLQVPLFLKDAPPCLRHRLMAAAYMIHLKKHPAFKHCEHAFLRHVVGHLKPFTYDDDMYVVREGEITNSMYFVHKGRIQELIEMDDEYTYTYETGDFFGTSQGLYRETPFTHSYKTLNKSQVLTLSLDDWEYLLKHFPINKVTIYKPHKGFGDFKEKKRAMSIKSDEGSPLSSRTSLLQTKLHDVPKPPKTVPSIRFGDLSKRQPQTPTRDIKEPFSEVTDREGLAILSASSVAAAAAAAAMGPTVSERSSHISEEREPGPAMRKSNVLDIDKTPAKEELRQAGSGQNVKSLASMHTIDQYVKSQAQFSKQSSIQYPDIDLSRWPLDSRRRFSSQESAAMKEHESLAQENEETKDLPKSKYARRKSTVFNVDRSATQKELELGSAEKEDEYVPNTSDYSRRKSKMFDVDITDKELPTPTAEPLSSKRSSIEETELRSISYAGVEGRSLLAPPSERPEPTESLMSVHIPHESVHVSSESVKKTDTHVPLKSILAKTHEESKSSLQKIKSARSTLSQRSHAFLGEAERDSLPKSLSHGGISAGHLEKGTGKKYLQKKASSIIFKDDIKTMVISDEPLLEHSLSLGRALSRHAQNVSPEEVRKAPTLKRTRHELSLEDITKREQKISSLEKSRTVQSLQDLTAQKDPKTTSQQNLKKDQKIPTLERRRIEQSQQNIRAKKDQKIPTLEKTRTERSLQDLRVKKDQKSSTPEKTQIEHSLQDLPAKKDQKSPTSEKTQIEHSLQDLPAKKDQKSPTSEKTQIEHSLQDLRAKKDQKSPTPEKTQIEHSLQDFPAKKTRTERSLQDLRVKKDQKSPTPEKTQIEHSLQDLPAKDKKKSTLKRTQTEHSLQDLRAKKDQKSPTLKRTQTEHSLQDLRAKKDHKIPTLERTETEHSISLQDLRPKKDHKIPTLERTETKHSISLQDLRGKKDQNSTTLKRTQTEHSLQDLRAKKDQKIPSLERTRTEHSLQDLNVKKVHKIPTLERTETEHSISLQDLRPKKDQKIPTLERTRTEQSPQDLRREKQVQKKENKDDEPSTSKKST